MSLENIIGFKEKTKLWIFESYPCQLCKVDLPQIYLIRDLLQTSLYRWEIWTAWLFYKTTDNQKLTDIKGILYIYLLVNLI